MTTKTKLLVSAALLAGAASAAGLGTFGSFTSTTSASAAVNSGTVAIGVGAAGSTDNRLTVAAANIVPGDTIQRAIKLSNTGNSDLASVSLTTTALTSSLLDTNAGSGLQLAIDKCSTAWTETGTVAPFTYTCGGTTTPVLASTPVIGANRALGGLSSLTANTSDYLRVTLSFPTSADNSFQNQASTINFAFTGQQRAGTNK
jgi:hypothetical protein